MGDSSFSVFHLGQLLLLGKCLHTARCTFVSVALMQFANCTDFPLLKKQTFCLESDKRDQISNISAVLFEVQSEQNRTLYLSQNFTEATVWKQTKTVLIKGKMMSYFICDCHCFIFHSTEPFTAVIQVYSLNQRYFSNSPHMAK